MSKRPPASERLMQRFHERTNPRPVSQGEFEARGWVPFTFRGGPADGEVMWCPPDASGEAGCGSPCGDESDQMVIHTYQANAARQEFDYVGPQAIVVP